MRKTSYTISNLVCPECGHTFPIPRRKGSQRKQEHIKDIWCPYCRKVQKTIEYQNSGGIRTLAGTVIYKSTAHDAKASELVTALW